MTDEIELMTGGCCFDSHVEYSGYRDGMSMYTCTNCTRLFIEFEDCLGG